MDRISLDYHLPLTLAVAEWLVPQARAAAFGTPSLDHILVIVPTGEAGRQLRLALTKRLGALVPPRIVQPRALLEPVVNSGGGSMPTAMPAEWLSLLADELRRIGPDELGSLLPPKGRPHESREEAEAAGRLETPLQALTFAWGLGMARQFAAVWDELGKAGLTIADVASRAATGIFPTPESPLPDEEVARWRDFAELERRLFGRLHAAGREHPVETRRRWMRDPHVPEGVERIVLPALVDAPPAFHAVLAALASAGTPIDVLLHTPESEASSFDEWGRPTGVPAQAGYPALDDAHIRRCPDPAHQAAAVADAFLAEPDAAIGMADPDLLPALVSAFLSRQKPLHNPADVPVRETSLGRVIDLVWGLLGAPRPMVGAMRFLRTADVRSALSGPASALRGVSPERALSALDALCADHLPLTVEEFADYLDRLQKSNPPENTDSKDPNPEAVAVARQALAAVEELLATPEGVAPRSVEHLLAVLRRVFRRRVLDESKPGDRDFEAAALAVRDAVRAAVSPVLDGLLAEDERVLLVRLLIGQARYSLEADPDATPLLGWLELPWCPAKRLLVAGCNEGHVPESVTGDAFLPDPVRRALGLPSNEQRLARDAALLADLLRSRAPGDVTVFFGKLNAQGDPLKPSRLLYLCDNADLPARAQAFFADPETTPRGFVSAVPDAWRLRMPEPPPVEQLSVTQIGPYLEGPLGYFLERHVLGDGPPECELPSEFPGNVFGSICHVALQAFGENEPLRDSEDPEAIAAFLVARVEAEFRARCAIPADRFPVVLRLQRDAVLARVRAFAERQAALRAEGWRIVAAEYRLHGEFGGVLVHGRADRIDRNDAIGAWRIIDYKTWRNADDNSPFAKNVAALGENPGAAGIVSPDGKAKKYWRDPQLPLYALLARQTAGLGIPADAPVEGRHFVLADKPGDTKLADLPKGMEDHAEAWLELARLETEFVCRRMRAGLYLSLPLGIALKPIADLLPAADPLSGLDQNWVRDQIRRLRDFDSTIDADNFHGGPFHV